MPDRILNQTFLWMLLMMRAAFAMQKEGYDPRLLFLATMMPTDQFLRAIEKHRGHND